MRLRGTGGQRCQPIPERRTELGWPFRVVLNWSKEAVPLHFSTDHSVDSGCHLRGSLTLGETASLGIEKCLERIQPEAIITQRSRQREGQDWPVSFLEGGSRQCIIHVMHPYLTEENHEKGYNLSKVNITVCLMWVKSVSKLGPGMLLFWQLTLKSTEKITGFTFCQLLGVILIYSWSNHIFLDYSYSPCIDFLFSDSIFSFLHRLFLAFLLGIFRILQKKKFTF